MIIGVSGYGFTGSSACYDLLREYDEIKFPEVKGIREFSLPYIPSGLLDLEYALVDFPVKHLRGDFYLNAFINMTRAYRKSYDKVTQGKFSAFTDQYISSLIQVSYPGRRTSDYYGNRLLYFLYGKITYLERKLSKRFHKNIRLWPRTVRYISVAPENFAENTRKYVSDIIHAMGQCDEERFVLDQPFPPNYPEKVFHFFDDPYAIIVDRDPRDLYSIAKRKGTRGWEFMPRGSVEEFVKYYQAIRVHAEKEDDSRVLRLQFEDLIYRYDDTVRRIETFLGISRHTRAKVFFQPDVSIKNTQIYRAYPEDAEEIKYIEEHLRDYLYDFDSVKRDVDMKEFISNGKYTK